MNNLILFLNSFFSYIVLMAVIVCVAAAGMFVGIKCWKTKDAKEETQEAAEGKTDTAVYKMSAVLFTEHLIL